MEQNMSAAKNKGCVVAPSNQGKDSFDLADVSHAGDAYAAMPGGSSLVDSETAEEAARKISARKTSGNSSVAGGGSVDLGRGF